MEGPGKRLGCSDCRAVNDHLQTGRVAGDGHKGRDGAVQAGYRVNVTVSVPGRIRERDACGNGLDCRSAVPTEGKGNVVHNGSIVIEGKNLRIVQKLVKVGPRTLNDVVVHHVHIGVAIRARLLMPQPNGVAHFMKNGAERTLTCPADLLWPANFSYKGLTL